MALFFLVIAVCLVVLGATFAAMYYLNKAVDRTGL